MTLRKSILALLPMRLRDIYGRLYPEYTYGSILGAVKTLVDNGSVVLRGGMYMRR